jgi:hypothetical protein
MRMSGCRSPRTSPMPTHVHTPAPFPRPAQTNSFDSQPPYSIGKQGGAARGCKQYAGGVRGCKQ